MAAVEPTSDRDQPEPSVLVVVAPLLGGDGLASVITDLDSQDFEAMRLVVATSGDVDTRIDELADIPLLSIRRAGCYADAYDAVVDLGFDESHLLFCRDNVEPAPDAIRAMVECAVGTSSDVVGCKIVEQSRPDRLVSVGVGIDKLGGTVHQVELDELDQGQHDATTDALAVDFVFVLIAADLLQTLRGFDPEIDRVGDDVDFCWQAHAVGARVAVTPDAAVLYDPPPLDTQRRMRHQLRSLFGTYGVANLVLAIPLLLVLSISEVVGAVLAARPRRLRNIVTAWTWNLIRVPSLFDRRARLHRARAVADVRLRYRLVDRDPWWRLFDYTRHDADEERNRGQEFVDALRSSTTRAGVAMWMIVGVAFVFGSRLLLSGDLPAIGQFQPVPEAPSHLLAQWWTGYSKAGLGVESVGPTGAFAAGLFLTVLSPIAGAIRTILFLGVFPVAAVGSWKLSRAFGRSHAQVALVVGYLSIPVAYDAFARGNWAAISVFAGTPWILWRLVRLLRAAPYGYIGGTKHPSVPNQPLLYQSLLLGVFVALVGLVTPFVVVVVATLVVGLALGSAFSLQLRGIPRVILGVLIALGAALLIHLPWVVALVEKPLDWNAFGGSREGIEGSLRLIDLLQFDVGPNGLPYVGFGLIVAGIPGLLIGRDWRLAWASRGWFIALAGFGLAWVGERGWLGVSMPSAELLLIPAGLGLALAAAASVAAFEVDVLEAHPYRPPRRKVLIGAFAVLGLAAATIPVLISSFDGRWNLPKNDIETAVSFVGLDQSDGPFRILWIGDDSVMPLRGWPVDDDSSLTFATTDGRAPTLADQWLVPENNDVGRIRNVIDEAWSGRTARVGASLAELGVKYVIFVESNATFTTDRVAVPSDLLQSLGRQLDLEVVDGTNSAITVYENAVWTPTRLVAPDTGEDLDVSLGRAVLQPSGYTSFDGRLAGSTTFYLASTSDRWELRLNGEVQERQAFNGWASTWAVATDSDAVVQYKTPSSYRSLTLMQIASWIVIVISITGWRSRMEQGV